MNDEILKMQRNSAGCEVQRMNLANKMRFFPIHRHLYLRKLQVVIYAIKNPKV